MALETFQTEDLWQKCEGNGENSPFEEVSVPEGIAHS